MSTHTLSVLVADRPGVLARVSALFSRRGFNIDSLAVGPTEQEDISRITLVVDAEEHTVEQLTKQLNKLVEVIKIVELEPDAVRQELMLIKVATDAATRSDVLEVIQLFKAKAVDATNEAIVVMATGSPEKLQAMLTMLEPFGVRELVQSGLVALGRGPRSITDRSTRADRQRVRVV
ncbi:acetolactate synthase small subunit [Desertihabitans brevis]|uniref:Acetolactate synthase small subunit n=1 Tax=Desertihabitans brevis TaxID=2268447 RepID=A0A367Z001_9ACTN|nr:acetolactate synthase small subunit [Desertihabitans brevis]RCK71424.1 acetolactate synthase small subunit [Desertihabitans brevis]